MSWSRAQSGQVDLQRREAMLQRFLWAYLASIVFVLLIATNYPAPWAASSSGARNTGVDLTLQSRANRAELSRPQSIEPTQVAEGEESDQKPVDFANSDAMETGANPPTQADAEYDDETAKSRNRLGIIESRFSLANVGAPNVVERIDTNGRIETKKDVLVRNTVIGTIPIVVDGASNLFLHSNDLKAILAGQDGLKSRLEGLPSTGLVSFRRLRDMGIDLRYNPASDNVSVRGL